MRNLGMGGVCRIIPVEFHLLDTGHFALEEDGDLIAERIRACFNVSLSLQKEALYAHSQKDESHCEDKDSFAHGYLSSSAFHHLITLLPSLFLKRLQPNSYAKGWRQRC